MSEDVWGDDERTNAAMEHFRSMAAKVDADGAVVPRHRYTRNPAFVIGMLLDSVYAPRYQHVSITDERKDGRTIVTVEIEVEGADGQSWTQTGVVSSEEGFYSWHAMAMCRALLNYTSGDDEPMTPDQVLAMLQEQRAEYIARQAARQPAPTGSEGGQEGRNGE